MEVDLKLDPIENWGIKRPGRPLIIAGPCSAETEEQVMETAQELNDIGVEVYRAGIWKPRTRPNSFEGVGTKGLKWMRKVKEELGMLISTEVANAAHVFEALKYGVDILWIGARTSANPFAVQEIADALSGVDIPVLVKNPVNPDVDLWIGALERINKAGITKLAAIHRGFSTYEKTAFRNHPQWQIPIELRRRRIDLPIFCDPSHIAGKADLVFEVSQKAMDLSHYGLIIETHINPKKALSDAQQQITPAQLKDLINRLVLRAPLSEDPKFLHSLEDLRRQIDHLDDELMDILGKRMKVAETIGKYKKENNIRILQTARWDEIVHKSLEKGNLKGLSEEFINRLFKAIHQESINHQMKVMNSDSGEID